MRHWGRRAVALVLGALFLSACGDNHVLNERALVLVMGVEPAGGGRIRVDLQIPSPRGLTTLGPGGTGSAESGSRQTFFVLSGSGRTLSSALAHAQGRSTQALYLGQLQAIILSTRLSPELFTRVMSSLARIGTLDQTTYVLASPQPLARVLAVAPQQSTLPGLYYATLFSCRRCQTVDLARQLWSLEKRQLTPLVSAWVPVVEIGPTGFQVDRVALYRQGRPEMVLSRGQTNLLGLLLSRTSKVPWILPGPDGTVVGIRALQARTRFRPSWRNGRLEIAVRIAATGLLSDFPLQQAARKAVPQLEREASASLAAGAVQLLQRLAGRHLDPFDLGAAFVWRHPQAAAVWMRAFPRARWRVRVEVTLIRYGDAT